MTEPSEATAPDDMVQQPADQSWLEVENVRGGGLPAHTRDIDGPPTGE
jgi:hypothetical protein